MHAAIVAGGLGTRAAGLTDGRIPKALLPVVGFLVYLLIRPARTLKEREMEEMLRVLLGEDEDDEEDEEDTEDSKEGGRE